MHLTMIARATRNSRYQPCKASVRICRRINLRYNNRREIKKYQNKLLESAAETRCQSMRRFLEFEQPIYYGRKPVPNRKLWYLYSIKLKSTRTQAPPKIKSSQWRQTRNVIKTFLKVLYTKILSMHREILIKLKERQVAKLIRIINTYKQTTYTFRLWCCSLIYSKWRLILQSQINKLFSTLSCSKIPNQRIYSLYEDIKSI